MLYIIDKTPPDNIMKISFHMSRSVQLVYKYTMFSTVLLLTLTSLAISQNQPGVPQNKLIRAVLVSNFIPQLQMTSNSMTHRVIHHRLHQGREGKIEGHFV